MLSLPWRADGETTRLAIRLTPRGGRDQIEGCTTLSDGNTVMLARVRAAPQDGAANAALIATLVKALGITARDVAIASGQTSRLKILRIALPLADIEPKLRVIAGIGATT